MNKIFIILMLFATLALNAKSLQDEGIITIYNLSESEHKIWLSGESYSIQVNGGLIVACYPGESYLYQKEDKTTMLLCGEKKVINDE